MALRDRVVRMVIHPPCATDEYAMSLRSWVWLIPKIPPIKILMMASAKRVENSLSINLRWHRSARGASFCQVMRRRQLIHLVLFITDGTQK